jgi:hypothetical protein
MCAIPFYHGADFLKIGKTLDSCFMMLSYLVHYSCIYGKAIPGKRVWQFLVKIPPKFGMRRLLTGEQQEY